MYFENNLTFNKQFYILLCLFGKFLRATLTQKVFKHDGVTMAIKRLHVKKDFTNEFVQSSPVPSEWSNGLF